MPPIDLDRTQARTRTHKTLPETLTAPAETIAGPADAQYVR
ncbi:hypothetical protein [Streptomyces sp. NPDC059459]